MTDKTRVLKSHTVVTIIAPEYNIHKKYVGLEATVINSAKRLDGSLGYLIEVLLPNGERCRLITGHNFIRKLSSPKLASTWDKCVWRPNIT